MASISSQPSVPSATLLDRSAENRRRARRALVTLGVAVGLVVGLVLAVLVHPVVGVVAGIAAGVVAHRLAGRDADGAVLRSLGGRPADPVREARLHNLVEGLSLAAGVPPPALQVLDDDRPNALALGRGARTATVVVTSGLLEQLERVELEAVLAHELSHIRSGDTEPGTLAAHLSRLPLVGGLVRSGLIDADREAIADLNGVAVTRFPPGLAAALEKLRGAASPGALPPGPAACHHLWIVSATDPGNPSPDIDERIDALREL